MVDCIEIDIVDCDRGTQLQKLVIAPMTAKARLRTKLGCLTCKIPRRLGIRVAVQAANRSRPPTKEEVRRAETRVLRMQQS